jgi:hypothetical protein
LRVDISKKDFRSSWYHLERAHILGQPYPYPHTLVHWKIVLFGIKIKDIKEIKCPKCNSDLSQVFTGNTPIINKNPQGGYSLNAGAAIDPDALIYYYNNGSNLIGVSLITGTVVSVVTLAFEDGMYFDLMRNFENCNNGLCRLH